MKLTNDIKHLNTLLRYSKLLEDSTNIEQYEPKLRKLEKQLVIDNFDLIIELAKEQGLEFIKNPIVIDTFVNKKQAAFYRYLMVPLLYKLGFNQLAANFGQKTFEYLFPQLNEIISKEINRLMSDDRKQKINKIVSLFTNPNEDCRCYYREKSINSIWKKVPSIIELKQMDPEAFRSCVDDFFALRWNMKVLLGENRVDALINGVRNLPNIQFLHFRNQVLPQAEGFACEPVIKFYYRIENLSVELQILGGDIESYLTAKGYADYKANIHFPPDQARLTEQQKNARLGQCLYFQENGKIKLFRQLMLDELVGNKVVYDQEKMYILEKAPANPINRTYMLPNSGERIPVYQLAQYTPAAAKRVACRL